MASSDDVGVEEQRNEDRRQSDQPARARDRSR